MGRRSRRRAGAPPAGPRAERKESERKESRSEARDAQARARLRPLEPGERPPALIVAVVVAVALAILATVNVALYVAGVEVHGERPSPVGVMLFALLMLVAAVGMWQRRYWAVLGFQALLALLIVIAGVSLAVASNLAAVAQCLGVVVLAGTLFWKLVRVMGRIQLPYGALGSDREGPRR